MQLGSGRWRGVAVAARMQAKPLAADAMWPKLNQNRAVKGSGRCSKKYWQAKWNIPKPVVLLLCLLLMSPVFCSVRERMGHLHFSMDLFQQFW